MDPTASTSARTLPPLPPLDVALSAASFSTWYPLFRKVSPKATIIDVEDVEPQFLDWLEEDGLTLPQGSGGKEEEFASAHFEDDSEEEEYSDQSDSGEHDIESTPRRFMALDERIRQILDKYEGRVFPKLNWSAPRDAAWILPGSNLQCHTPADVYLLLKSSDFVMKDVEQAKELERIRHESTTPSNDSAARPRIVLALKKWFDMPPSHEFRCFVRSGKFVAIAQRDSNFYEHLQPSEDRRRIREKLAQFWQDSLRPRQLSVVSEAGGQTMQSMGVDDYIFDAYLTRDMSRVFLVDINPYIPRTDPLLWDWEELEDLASGVRRARASEVESEDGSSDTDDDSESSEGEEEDKEYDTVLRVYTDGSGRPPQAIRVPLTEEQKEQDRRRREQAHPKLRVIRSHLHSQQVACGGGSGSGAAPKYAHNMMPRDVLDASSNGESIAEFAREWQDRLTQAMR